MMTYFADLGRFSFPDLGNPISNWASFEKFENEPTPSAHGGHSYFSLPSELYQATQLYRDMYISQKSEFKAPQERSIHSEFTDQLGQTSLFEDAQMGWRHFDFTTEAAQITSGYSEARKLSEEKSWNWKVVGAHLRHGTTQPDTLSTGNSSPVINSKVVPPKYYKRVPIRTKNGQRIYEPLNEMKTTELFITGLNRFIYEDKILPSFDRWGEVCRFRLMMDFSGTNRGYAFIEYVKEDDAKQAMRNLNGCILHNRKLRVVESTNNCSITVHGIPICQLDAALIIIIQNRNNNGIFMANKKNHDGRNWYFSITVTFPNHVEAAKCRYALLQRNVFPEWKHMNGDAADIMVGWSPPKTSWSPPKTSWSPPKTSWSPPKTSWSPPKTSWSRPKTDLSRKW